MIKKCNCNSEFQDKEHGKGNRVHTVGAKGDERCTVCGPKPSGYARLDSHARLHDPKIHNYK